jgi:hypothetical protein
LATTESQYKFEYARQEPPEEFDWVLCTCDLNKKYKALVDKEIGDEVIEQRGSQRLETLHTILEKPGVLGRKRLQPEVIYGLLSELYLTFKCLNLTIFIPSKIGYSRNTLKRLFRALVLTQVYDLAKKTFYMLQKKK